MLYANMVGGALSYNVCEKLIFPTTKEENAIITTKVGC
jgi:hypothetical protein